MISFNQFAKTLAAISYATLHMLICLYSLISSGLRLLGTKVINVSLSSLRMQPILRKHNVACITVCPIVSQQFWKSIARMPSGPSAFQKPNWKAASLISFILNSLSNICRCRCESPGNVYVFKTSIILSVLLFDFDQKILWKCCCISSLNF